MDFLRPYTHVSKTGRKKYKKSAKINEYVPKTKVSAPMKRERLHRQTAVNICLFMNESSNEGSSLNATHSFSYSTQTAMKIMQWRIMTRAITQS